jgi:divalent metal cation (Fe/Co/Zn/Cd) transporter
MPRQESSALPGVRSAGARKPDASRRVIYAGIAGNSLIAICKLVAAVLTHSSAMLSEAVHSLVDTSNQLLML